MKLDDDIHNYYEHLVLEHITNLGLDKSQDENYLADLTCMTLNELPPRYIRYEVDMAFYLPPSERMQMETKVDEAIAKARKFLDSKKSER